MRTAASPEAQQIYDELILVLLDEFRKIRETLHACRKIGRSEGVLKQKLRRMGVLVVVTFFRRVRTTTSMALGNGLFTHEEASKVLADTIDAL